MSGSVSLNDGAWQESPQQQQMQQQQQQYPQPQFPYPVWVDELGGDAQFISSSGAETIHLADHDAFDNADLEPLALRGLPAVASAVASSPSLTQFALSSSVACGQPPQQQQYQNGNSNSNSNYTISMSGNNSNNNHNPRMVNNGSNSNNAAASATVLSDSGEPDVNAVVRDPSTILSGSGETILAREIAKLSTSEREAIMHDIHGVTDEEHFKETPALIAEKLTQLESKIQQLMQHQMRHNTNSNDAAADRPGNIGTAYSLALAMNPEYVQDASFRLMFLRASHFDVAQAAKRFLGHFEKKMELFGASKLVKTITLEDLDADDNECLLRGQSQLLPYRDRSGRAVFVQALSHYQYKQVVNALRVIYFLLMCAVEDEETQKKGIVSVVYNVEPRTPVANDTRIYLNVYQLLPTLPIRMMGAHYCVQDSDLRRFMSSIRVAMSREVRLRSRVHHGSHQECIYTLMTFGVPRKCFPISDTGELLVEKHVEFLAMRRKQEAAASAMMHAIEDMNAAGRGVGNSNSSNHLSVPLQQQQHLIKRIIVPTNVDVLLGRGRPFQEHAGNMRCNFVVVAAMEEYEQVSRNDKTGVSRNVISKIKGYGGRFLKQNDGVWEEVDDAEALKKISHSFRTHRQLLKTHQESNSGVTSSKCKQLSSPVQNDSHSHKRQKD